MAAAGNEGEVRVHDISFHREIRAAYEPYVSDYAIRK